MTLRQRDISARAGSSQHHCDTVSTFNKSKQSLNNEQCARNRGLGAGKKKGKHRVPHVEKCLAVQQKRKHLKLERKESAGE